MMPTAHDTGMGYAWFAGKSDVKKAMQAAAKALPIPAEVQLSRMGNFGRSFGYFDTWPHFWAYARQISPACRTFNELIVADRPCKPYLDLDWKSGPWPEDLPHHRDIKAIASRGTALIQEIFREDFGIELPEESIFWTHSEGTPKMLSLHMTISTHSPQLLYSSNLKKKEHSAYHLAYRLQKKDPKGIGAVVDISVYSADREMRMQGCVKHEVPGVMTGVFGHEKKNDTTITWIDPPGVRQMLVVPAGVMLELPRVATRATHRGYRSIAEVRALNPAFKMFDDKFKFERMLACVKKWHPTAYVMRPNAPNESLEGGIRFCFTDFPGEPCYSGVVHTSDNFIARIMSNGDILCRCFSAKCDHVAPIVVGSLAEGSNEWLEKATRICHKYVEFHPFAAVTINDFWDPSIKGYDAVEWARHPVKIVAKKWIDGKFPVLCLNSVMGTGKTVFMTNVIHSLFEKKTVLIIVYRQSLAEEHSHKLKDLGFVNYMDVKNDDLSDRKKFPRVIVQIESLWRLRDAAFGPVPVFDLVVMDEMDSALRHFPSMTIKDRVKTVELVSDILKAGKRVLAMDALFGEGCHAFIKSCGLGQHLIYNDYVPSQRVYEVINDEKKWLETLVRDVLNDRRIVIPVMSVSAADRVHALLLAAGIDPAMIIKHTSRTDHALKRRLRDVNDFWVKYDVLIYTPTIEAGVDFNVADHFHSMYVYTCLESTSPWGLSQMMGRIRNLGDKHVLIYSHKLMCLTLFPINFWHVSIEEAREYVRWMATKLDDKRERAVVWQPQREYRVVGGEGVRIPVDGPEFAVASYNHACHLNGHHRFMAELADLLERRGGRFVNSMMSGHKGVGEDTEVAGVNLQQLKHEGTYASYIMGANDFLTPEGFECALDRKERNKASAEDIAMVERACYKRSWGVDVINETFVKKHSLGADLTTSLRFEILIGKRTVNGNRIFDIDLTGKLVTEKASVELLPMIDDVILALGFTSPMDSRCIAEDSLVSLYERRLKSTPFFAEFANNIKYFTRYRGARIVDASSELAIANALECLLARVGLKLVRDRKRVQRNGRRESWRVVLSLKGYREMVELVWLRNHRTDWNKYMESLDLSSREALQRFQFPDLYAELVVPEPEVECWIRDRSSMILG